MSFTSTSSTSDIFIEKVFGTDPQSTAKPVYVYKQWQDQLTTYTSTGVATGAGSGGLAAANFFSF